MLYGILYVVFGLISLIVVTAIIWHQVFPWKKDKDD